MAELRCQTSESAAITLNSIGEELITLRRLPEAIGAFNKALEIRDARGTRLDAAVTRDNFGRAFETGGQLEEAQRARLGRDQLEMVCSNVRCAALPAWRPRSAARSTIVRA